MPGMLTLMGIILRGLAFEGRLAESGSDCLHSQACEAFAGRFLMHVKVVEMAGDYFQD